MTEEENKKIPLFDRGRVFRSGFHEFSGPKPDCIRMGIYGDVILEQVEERIFQVVTDWQVNSQLKEGIIHLDARAFF